MNGILFGLVSVLSIAACGGSAGSTGSTTPNPATDNVGTIALKNSSHFDIYSIQLSPYDHPEWGANLVANDPLMHGETEQIAVFDCKKYDLRMVDDEQVECVIQDIDLCFEDKAWSLTDDVLASCATGWAD
jgi:hypothetical protein